MNEKSIELYGDEIGYVEYIDHMGSDITVVNAARVSFGKHKQVMDEKDEKLIRYLIKHRHTSPFEHCSVTFRFTVPLFVRSQHHHHRTWSYDTRAMIFSFMNRNCLGHNINLIGKRAILIIKLTLFYIPISPTRILG